MGEVVELFSVGTFRARFLIEEWEGLLREFNGDGEKATRAHLALCRDWAVIWGADPGDTLRADEARVAQLSDKELLAMWHQTEGSSFLLDLIAGEMERRDLDD